MNEWWTYLETHWNEIRMEVGKYAPLLEQAMKKRSPVTAKLLLEAWMVSDAELKHTSYLLDRQEVIR